MEKTKKTNVKTAKGPNLFVRWYRLAQPSKKLWLWQIVFYVGYAILLTLLTVFAARTIDCMYEKNWSGAFLNLGLELATIVLRSIFYHIQYKFYNDQVTYIRVGVAKKIYNKLMHCENNGFKKLSKDKILNISLNNMDYLSDFPDVVSSFIAYSVQIVIILVTVFVANYWAGLIVTALGVLNFFVYYWFNKKIGKAMMERHEKKDGIYSSYVKIIDGKPVINELKGKKKYEQELVGKVNDYCDSFTKYFMLSSWKESIYYAFWNIIVYLITALMLFFVSQGGLDIAIYLIIVPYFTTCTEKLNFLFDKTKAVENMRVDVDRVSLILSLSDKQLEKYGRLNAKTPLYNLGLIDVSYSNNSKSDPLSISNADISFKMQGINIIKGDKGCGKRLVFNMLRRTIRPQQGKVLLNNRDLYKYDENSFNREIYYSSSHPSFVDGSIKENLMLMSKNLKKINAACERVGLKQHIDKLQNGMDTPIRDIRSSGILFLIGLARALLTDCKILMIYEIPQDCPLSFKNKFKKFISSKREDRTIIFFTHESEFDDLADIVYEIESGNVKQIKAKNKTN